MKFEEALKAMREGKKINLGGHIYYLRRGKITVLNKNTKYCYFFDYEVLSEDWEIVNEV